MNPLLVALFSVGSAVAGVDIFKLQAQLERWEQRRHASD
jgi:hypothetical protein